MARIGYDLQKSEFCLGPAGLRVQIDVMIKPIVYRSFQEKEELERVMMKEISLEKRRSVSKALMNIFHPTAPTKKARKKGSSGHSIAKR